METERFLRGFLEAGTATFSGRELCVRTKLPKLNVQERERFRAGFSSGNSLLRLLMFLGLPEAFQLI